MNIRLELVAAALREVGVREDGGNNLGERVRIYQQATWLPPGAWPWCAAFTAWSLRAALIAHGVPPALADKWRCRDASAFGWLAWAKRTAGCQLLEPTTTPMAGDIPVFDFNGPTSAGGGHIGIVERGGLAAGLFNTVEGNTNDAGDRDSTKGDGVLRKSRSGRSLVNFIRLPERL